MTAFDRARIRLRIAGRTGLLPLPDEAFQRIASAGLKRPTKLKGDRIAERSAARDGSRVWRE